MGKLTKLDHVAFAGLGGLAAWWLSVPVLLQALIILTALDVLTGWGKAVVTHKLSSDASRAGAIRKGMAFLLVGAGWVCHYKLGVPIRLDEVLAGFFCSSELLSIVENCQEAGLRIPAGITKWFKLPEERRR